MMWKASLVGKNGCVINFVERVSRRNVSNPTPRRMSRSNLLKSRGNCLSTSKRALPGFPHEPSRQSIPRYQRDALGSSTMPHSLVPNVGRIVPPSPFPFPAHCTELFFPLPNYVALPLLPSDSNGSLTDPWRRSRGRRWPHRRQR